MIFINILMIILKMRWIPQQQKNETDFMILFMWEENRESFHYLNQLSINLIGLYQLILYNEKNLKNTNLTKFTNILYQIWAKKGNELYICDFIPNTLVVAYLEFLIIYNIY